MHGLSHTVGCLADRSPHGGSTVRKQPQGRLRAVRVLAGSGPSSPLERAASMLCHPQPRIIAEINVPVTIDVETATAISHSAAGTVEATY